ncbi:MAG: hypothetical protein Q9176_004813 [Flavoplaca citrina]
MDTMDRTVVPLRIIFGCFHKPIAANSGNSNVPKARRRTPNGTLPSETGSRDTVGNSPIDHTFHPFMLSWKRAMALVRRSANAKGDTNGAARYYIRSYLDFLCNHVKAEKFIRSPKLTLPCLQTLSISQSAIPDEAEKVDFLSPPRYLHVAEPIIFEFVGNTELPEKSKACDCYKFQGMLHHIHAKYSRPTSEEQSLHDEEWNWI